MKTTVRGVILETTEEQRTILDELMFRYCAAVRWSFKRLLDGWKTQDIRLAVQEKFNLNSRQANDAVFDAQTTIKSQMKMVKYHHAKAISKVEYIKKQLARAKSPKRTANLQKRLDKEQKKLAYWQKHMDNKTFPSVVFGSKKLFLKRCKGLISREEWQDARSNRYLSRGDKSKGGNLNTRICVIGDNIYLEIVADPIKTEKSVRYNRIIVPVYLAHKPSMKTGKINGINYRQMVLDYLKTGEAYQVEIIREKGRYYVHVSIEETTPVAYTARNGAVGIDTNPDGLGIAYTDYQGQFKESLWQSLSECTYARRNRRENLIGEAVAMSVDMAQRLNCVLVVEDLVFKDDISVTTKFKRMSHSFIWSKFLTMTERRAIRQGVPIVKVEPPFTSIIGILKYQSQYGLSNHEAAGYVIARRGLGCENEKVPKTLVKRFIKKNKRTEFYKTNNWKQWSSMKKAAVAAIKKHTRKEVKNLVSWQHYRKQLLVTG